jgi:hypothetical protein
MITFHQFTLSDVEDPEIYAAQPIWEWEKSEPGQWCMENSTVPVAYRIVTDYNIFGYRVDLYGDLTPEDRTYYNLKWGIK